MRREDLTDVRVNRDIIVYDQNSAGRARRGFAAGRSAVNRATGAHVIHATVRLKTLTCAGPCTGPISIVSTPEVRYGKYVCGSAQRTVRAVTCARMPHRF